jgi:hypothetical protein
MCPWGLRSVHKAQGEAGEDSWRSFLLRTVQKETHALPETAACSVACANSRASTAGHDWKGSRCGDTGCCMGCPHCHDRQPAADRQRRANAPLSRKKGMLRASSLGCIRRSPLTMKPNCLAPAPRYCVTCM